MAFVFEVQAKDVSELNAFDLTRLLNMLLHLEARSSGIDERTIEVTLNINVADGGEDGRIEWAGGPDSTDFLPSRLVQFQNKATKITASKCAREIVGRDGKLKPMVENALDNGGAYILFTTTTLTQRQKIDCINAIRNKLQNIGKSYAATVTIDIYDAARVQGWTNRYLSAITAVLNWIGRPLVHGLQIWDTWERYNDNHLFSYVTDQARREIIESLRRLLPKPRTCARFIGLSGLGKTRLALEACRDTSPDDSFSKRVIYIDAAYGKPNLPGVVSHWIQHGLDGLLVVDNCELRVHKQLRSEIEHLDSKMSLLTLHYDLEKDADTTTFQLGPMADEQIKSMLEPVYGDRISDLDRVVGFAQGFPQMAVLLAKARLEQAPEMGSLTDDDLLKKMLWGGGAPDANAKEILQGCSLFDVFGLEGEVAEELKFIAENIVGTTENVLYKCVKNFEARGIVNRAGRFAQIVPKPLAIRLAADWWRSTRRQRQQQLIATSLPGQLERSFCSQVSKLDFLPQVKELTADLCGTQGPFGQAEVILSDRGSRLFRAFVEVNPSATSEAVFNVLTSLNHEDLENVSGDARRNLVWALEKLCFHEAAFSKSAKCLLLLASAENEQWANNATGQLLQLFRVFLSGTEAPPALRLALLDEALTSSDIRIRGLCVRALESAIDTYGGSRTVGAEYQGSGEPLKEWRPRIWQEAFDYWTAALNRLTALVLETSSVSALAKDAIGSHIRGLMHKGRDVVFALDKSIKDIVKQQGPLWLVALASIKDSISYDSEGMPKEGVDKLNEWIELLTPERIEDRIELLVSAPPYEHEKGADENYIDIAALNAERFAQEVSGDLSVLIPHLALLLQGEKRQGYTFGRSLVLSAKEWEPLLSAAMTFLETADNPNISFVMGLLRGINELDSKRWDAYVTTFSSRTTLARYYPDVIRTGTVTKDHLQQVIELIAAGLAEENGALVFTYGRPLDELPPADVTAFVSQLRKMSINGAWIGLDILSMYCHGSRSKREACASTFKEMLVDLPLEKKRQLEMHHWQEVAERILDDNDADFARSLTRQILNSCNDKMNYGDVHHYIKPIIRLLFRNYGRDIWPIFAEALRTADPLHEYRLTELLSSENSFHRNSPSVLADLPEEVLKEWCKSEPDTAPELVARATDAYIEVDGEYQISPRTEFLLDEFGDNEHVLSALSANMGSFGWTGSVVPYHKKEVAALEPLLHHERPSVMAWANRRIGYLKKSIEGETIRDAEGEFGIH
ncbi:MAG: hypothetical protein ACREV1_02495 [Gammaproteobacteria bacterium]